VGDHPEMGTRYAISGDGIGKITVENSTLTDLFPAPGSVPANYPAGGGLSSSATAHRAVRAAKDE
jgi:hypothetical protein